MKQRTIWKRILALCLSLTLVFALSACGGGENSEDEGESGGKLKAQTDDTVVDMEGYEFTIASKFMQNEPDLSEAVASEAIFEEVRRKVEKDYNCKITILPYNNGVEEVRTKVLAQDKIADIIDVEGFNLIPMARAGYIVPLETVDGLNLTDTRWIEGLVNCTEYNGQHYGLSFLAPPDARVCMLYNRDLLKQYNLEDPQELLEDGKWTFDKFREMCKALTRDTNGDGTNDVWGCYTQIPDLMGISLIAANGGSLVKSVDGVAKENFNTTEAIDALNYLNDLVNVDKTISWGEATEKDGINNFVAGKYGFFYCEAWQMNQLLKPVCGDMDYGVLPLPMGPNAEDYVSPSENLRVFCITSTNKDIDKTVTILNALARYTEEYGEDADWWHYDLKMDFFQQDDDASVDAYLRLLDGATIDLGVGVTDLWTTFRYDVVYGTIFQKKGTPASKIDSITGKYQSAIDAIYN